MTSASAIVARPTIAAARRCVCSMRTGPIHLDHGKKNMFCPNVVGQSGTAMPEPVLVTRPPMKMSGSVNAATVSASLRGRAEAGFMLLGLRRGLLGSDVPPLREVVLLDLGRRVLV